MCDVKLTLERTAATAHLKTHNITVAEYESQHGPPKALAVDPPTRVHSPVIGPTSASLDSGSNCAPSGCLTVPAPQGQIVSSEHDFSNSKTFWDFLNRFLAPTTPSKIVCK